MTRREVITEAIDGQLSWVAEADIIAVTPRQMRRIRRAVECNGRSAVMDQRGGRPRRKRVTAQTISEICRLRRGMYADFSMRHFYERLTEQHRIAVSYTYVRQVLQEAGIVEKESGRGRYRRRRERRPLVGMLIHLDASTHEWIAGQPMQDLVVALDDADGRILGVRRAGRHSFHLPGAHSNRARARALLRVVHRPQFRLLPHRAGWPGSG
jgi:transposase